MRLRILPYVEKGRNFGEGNLDTQSVIKDPGNVEQKE